MARLKPRGPCQMCGASTTHREHVINSGVEYRAAFVCRSCISVRQRDPQGRLVWESISWARRRKEASDAT